MKSFNTSSPTELTVQVKKKGWLQRSYYFLSREDVIAELHYSKSYSNHAMAKLEDVEFEVRRRGFWKHYIEIRSTSHDRYNMKVDLSWRGSMKIVNADRNQYLFRQTNIWKSKWGWTNNRSERLLVEMRSTYFSRKNRGIITIKDPEMKDLLFWIIVSWFVILSSESDASATYL
jgi:hypothetical protein